MELTMLRRNVWTAAAAFVAASGILTGTSAAQSNEQAGAPADSNAPLLSGPTVSEDAATPKGPAMMGPNASKRKAEPRVPMRLWMREFEKLEISAEQQAQVDALQKEYEAEQQAFREVYGKQAAELTKAIREARQNGGEVPLDLRKEFQQLRENAPKFETYQQRIWEVLETPQRELMTANIDKAMKQIEQRRGPGARGEGDDQMRPRRGDRPGAEGDDARPNRRGFDDRGVRRRNFLMRHQMHHEGDMPAGDDEMDAPRRPRGERGERGLDNDRPRRPHRGPGEMPPPPPPGAEEGELPPPPPPGE